MLSGHALKSKALSTQADTCQLPVLVPASESTRETHTHTDSGTDTDTHARALSLTHNTARHLYSHGCF